MVKHPIIRIDKVDWGGVIFFESAILFPDKRAASGHPFPTAEQAEISAYRIIAGILLRGTTPCGSYAKGSGVVESQRVEFSKWKLAAYCCPLEIDCTLMSDLFPCSNFEVCRKAIRHAI